ncbi:MAG: hypothetical protein PHT12_05460 [Patescibacteria group bacterium]|nr:hypothetical protein [Patescibacteria group bacterium]
MTKRFIASVLTAVTLVSGPVFWPVAAAAAVPPTTGVSGPWMVANVAQDGDWTIETFKVDRDLLVWTALSADKLQRRLSAFDGSQTTVLVTMPTADWSGDGYFYDPVSGSYDVADGLVVWSEKDDSDLEIWTWNGTTVSRITDNAGDDRHPITSRGSIAWTNYSGSAYSLALRDASGKQRSLDAWIVQNYAWSGPNLYWVNKHGTDANFRAYRYDGQTVTALGDADDRPILRYFVVDHQGSAAWEYSTKQWDYDRRAIYVSENGAVGRVAIRRDVPPHISRLEDVRGGEAMLNSTDLVTSMINYNVSLIRTNGYTEKYVTRKSAPSKARYVEGGLIRHLAVIDPIKERLPETASPLIFDGDQGGEDYLSLDPVIHDLFESDGQVAAGALQKTGLATFVGGKGVTIPTAKVVTALAVQGGCIAWTEGESGHALLKMASRYVTVRLNGQTANVSGHLVKSSVSSVVYLAGSDGKRYAFPNEGVFRGWYPNFRSVRTVPSSTLASMPLAGNVLYRPGYRLVKSKVSPRVFAVGSNADLHWVRNASVLKIIYGADWNHKLDVVPETLLADYKVGAPIDEADRYYISLTGVK